MCVCVCTRAHTCACSVTQSCLTLCDPMNCSPPCSSVHGIFQARILAWAAISSSIYTHMRERDWHDIVNQLYLKKKKKSKNKQKNFKGAESQGRIEYHYFTQQRVAPLGSSFRYLPPRFFFPRPNNPLTRSSQENSFCKHDLNLSCSQFRKALLPSGHWQYLEPSGVVTCGECCWHSVHRGRGCC